MHVFIEHFESINVSSMSFFQFCVWIFRLPICVVFILGTSGNTFHPTFLAHREHFTNDFQFHELLAWGWKLDSWMGGARRDFDHFNEVHQHRKLPYYDVLGVRPDATTSEIIRAYRDLVDCFFIFTFFFRCGCYGMEQLTSLWVIFSWSSGMCS